MSIDWTKRWLALPPQKQREERDAALPMVDRLAATAAVARLEAFQNGLPVEMGKLEVMGHWLYHDTHDTPEGEWCGTCADAEVQRLDAKDGWTKDGGTDGWLIEGGYDAGSRPKTCEGCGRTISYCLSDDSALDELEHYVVHHVGPISLPSDVLAVNELCEWAKWLGPSSLALIEAAQSLVDRFDRPAFMARLPDAVKSFRDARYTAPDDVDDNVALAA